MALWIDGLKITKDHLHNVIRKFKPSQMPEDIRFLLNQIELKLQ